MDSNSSTSAPSSAKGKGNDKGKGKGKMADKGKGKGKGANKGKGKGKCTWNDLVDPAVLRIKEAYPPGSEERRFLLEELALEAWGVPRCAG